MEYQFLTSRSSRLCPMSRSEVPVLSNFLLTKILNKKIRLYKTDCTKSAKYYNNIFKDCSHQASTQVLLSMTPTLRWVSLLSMILFTSIAMVKSNIQCEIWLLRFNVICNGSHLPLTLGMNRPLLF